MDRTRGPVVSGREKVKRAAATAFAATGPKNPLRQLEPRDRELLWALLRVYGSRENNSASVPKNVLEIADATAADARKFAAQLERDLFQSPVRDVLNPFLSGFEGLPNLLRRLSDEVGQLFALVGKPGRKDEVFRNQLLIQASEFVRIKTGKHNDEHLAELFQAIGARDLGDDFSGEAIRKKRAYLKRQYPILYAETVAMGRQLAAHQTLRIAQQNKAEESPRD